MKILLDTNILLRSAQPAHSHYQQTHQALSVLDGANHELCLVPQNIYEFWVVATRPIENNGFGLDSRAAASLTSQCMSRLRMLEDEQGIFANWFALVQSYSVVGKNAHDTRLVAAMQRHSIVHLLTFNTSDFARFTSITANTPQDILGGRLPV